MEETRPFFERAFDMNPDANVFAYATFIGHGSMIKVKGTPDEVQHIPVPPNMQIFKKNLSICGFTSPSMVRAKHAPMDYLEDILTVGLEGCYPQKHHVAEYTRKTQPAKTAQYGYENPEQAAEDTCNILFDKTRYINKVYTPVGGPKEGKTHAPYYERHGVYKFNVVFITKEPSERIGPFDLFNADDLRELYRHAERTSDIFKTRGADMLRSGLEDPTTTAEEAAEMRKIVDTAIKRVDAALFNMQSLIEKASMPGTKPRITTYEVFNIFFLLRVNIAYIIDTSCSKDGDTPEGTIGRRRTLSGNEGYGKRKSKRRKRTSRRFKVKR